MRKIEYWLSIIALAITLLLSFGTAQAETLLERGAYLVKGIGTCGNCHTPRGGPLKGREMAGGNKFGGDKAPFTSYSANITPDRETGIGKWTDEQIIRSIREGKRPDGSTVGPPMPVNLYRNLSDTDARAIVAYLRSLKPVKNKVRKSIFRIPLPKAYGPTLVKVGDVPRNDPVRYGAYLAGPVGHCIECHTPQIKGRFDYANQLGLGGRTFYGPWGASISRNFTSHPKYGLGKWTDAQIKRAITEGVRADGTRLKPPMAYHMYKTISDKDMSAIIAYLRSLKPLPRK